MSGANFPRLKNWVSTEDVTYSDLNAEFDNILNNLTAAMVDDYSTDVTQMQSTTDPGEVGTESKATSVAGEIQRLRFMLAEITGKDEWYESPVSSIAGLANAIGTGLSDNRLVSGRVLSTSSQPAFLVPNGAARTVKLDGTPTSFIYYVDGVEYSITTDTTLTGLTAAPSSQNTCLINDANASGQYYTKTSGEDGTEIPIDTAGTEITALVGKTAGFKIGAEYFTAYVASATSLTKARRGYFFDSTDTAIPRVAYSNNDTITLMKLTWVFAKTDLTLTATYNSPVWSKDEPTSPSIGDYWFDLANNTWKVYGVGSYSAANAVLVGVCLQDSTNTVAARSFEFFSNYDSHNTVELIYESVTQVKSRHPGSSVSVWGNTILCDHNFRTWDITLDRDSGVSESASTFYYFYMTQAGDVVISDVKPHDRREDLGGFYHTHQSWRCLGRAFNSSGSDLGEVESYFRRYPGRVIRSVAATTAFQREDKFVVLSGASANYYLPDATRWRGEEFTLYHNGTSLSQVYTLYSVIGASQTIGGIASGSYALYTNGEMLRLISDGSNWLISDHRAVTEWTAFTYLTAGGTVASPGNNLISGVTTAPTYGTIALNAAFWRRNQRSAQVMWDYRHTAIGAVGSGGSYSFNLEAGLNIDTAYLTANTGTGSVSGSGYSSIVGTFDFGYSTNATGRGMLGVYSTTQLKAHVNYTNGSSTAAGIWGSSGISFADDAAQNFHIRAEFPVSGWRP